MKPKLLVLDPSANLFQVNENSRPAAIACIGMLRGLALDFDCAVLLLSHPSLSGLNSGSGTAGSTSWNNAVRSRLYFTARRPGADEDDESRSGHALPVAEEVELFEARRDDRAALAGWPLRPRRPGKAVRRSHHAHLDKVRAAFRDGDWRYDERRPTGAAPVARIIGLDIGNGLTARDITEAQKAARRKMRMLLSTWTRTNRSASSSGRTEDPQTVQILLRRPSEWFAPVCASHRFFAPPQWANTVRALGLRQCVSPL